MHELFVEMACLPAEDLADFLGVTFERGTQGSCLVGDHAVDGDRRPKDRVVEQFQALGERIVQRLGALDELGIERLLATL